MLLLYGLNRARAEVVVGPAGLALRVVDGSSGEKTYVVEADPLEIGMMALLVMGHAEDLRGKSWMWKGKEAQTEGGEKVILRAHWFVAPKVLKLSDEVTSLAIEDLRAVVKEVAKWTGRKPIFALTLEPVLADGALHTFLLGQYDLIALYVMSHVAARKRLIEEEVRIVNGLRVFAQQPDEDGGVRLGLSTGSSTVEWLNEEQQAYLRGVFRRALFLESPANFSLGALEVYVGGRELKRERAKGGSFWDVGVKVKVGQRRVTFRDPESAAALLVLLGL